MSDTKGWTRYLAAVGTLGGSEYYRVLTKGGSGSNPGAPKHLAPAGTTPGAMTKKQRTARAKLSARYEGRASGVLAPEQPRPGASQVLG